MSATFVVSAILTLLAGIGIFLIACSMMSSNLESVSSHRLRTMFAKVSKSKWLGVGIGAVATAAIQSSGATTVMVIGFVNAGIMSLVQAATIIFGANIGTTITGQIVALGMFGGEPPSSSVPTSVRPSPVRSLPSVCSAAIPSRRPYCSPPWRVSVRSS